MNSGVHPYMILSFKNLLRVATKQSKGLWVLGKKAKMTKSFSMALAETGILGFIESGLGKKGKRRLSATVPVADLKERPGFHPARVGEGVEPAVFPLSTTACTKFAFSEGNLGTPCKASLIKFDLGRQPLGKLRFYTTEHWIAHRQVTVGVLMYPIFNSDSHVKWTSVKYSGSNWRSQFNT